MERLLTAQDLAELTGLAVQTIYNRRSYGGSLPECLILGGHLRFRPRDVDAWLDTQYEKHHSKPVASSRCDEQPRRRGRPTKAEQVARRRGSAANG